MKNILILLIPFVILLSCANNEVDESNLQLNKKLISELREKACDTLRIGSNTLVLDAYIWRDFMPISPTDGKPMISINTLTDINSIAIPSNITLIEQYIIFNDSIWTAHYENEVGPIQPNYLIEKTSREGPKWGPEIYVDVISKVYDSNTNIEYFIQKEDVYIIRTE